MEILVFFSPSLSCHHRLRRILFSFSNIYFSFSIMSCFTFIIRSIYFFSPHISCWMPFSRGRGEARKHPVNPRNKHYHWGYTQFLFGILCKASELKFVAASHNHGSIQLHEKYSIFQIHNTIKKSIFLLTHACMLLVCWTSAIEEDEIWLKMKFDGFECDEPPVASRVQFPYGKWWKLWFSILSAFVQFTLLYICAQIEPMARTRPFVNFVSMFLSRHWLNQLSSSLTLQLWHRTHPDFHCHGRDRCHFHIEVNWQAFTRFRRFNDRFERKSA